MAPLKTDNRDERLARIEALMEEYRIKHEDLEAYVRDFEQRSRRARQKVRAGLALAKSRHEAFRKRRR